jgi:phage terminase large subunit-like protein
MDNLNAVAQKVRAEDANAYRRSVAKVMRLTTMAVVDSIYTKGAMAPNVLLSPAAAVNLAEKRATAEKWLLSQPVQKESPVLKKLSRPVKGNTAPGSAARRFLGK